MKSIFLDTSGWFAAVSPKEGNHKRAMDAYIAFINGGAQFVTTNLVVAEMQILSSRFRGTAAGVRFLDRLRDDPSHEVVYVDRELERAAVDTWLRKFDEQHLSLTDAVSFEVMRTRRIRDALALDAHFELAGFATVP